MRGRRVYAAAMIAVTVAALTSCTPEPTPSPHPTGFASDDEAFRAAEATYRAYVDALNAVDLAEPETFAEPLRYLRGNALQAEKDSAMEFRQKGIRLNGPIHVKSVTPIGATATTVSGVVCLDVSSTQILNADGVDVTPPDRADYLGLNVDFVWTATGTLVADSTVHESPCS